MSGTYYRPGENKSCCPVCGKEYRASEYRKRWDGLWVCRKDYEERHPQDFVRGRKDDMRPAVVAGCCGADGLPQIATAEAPLCPFPLEPLDNVVIGNATSASLSWSTFPGVMSYYIYLWEDGDSQPTSPTYTTTTSPYFVTGLTQNTGYNWYVSAVNGDGEFRDCSGNARFFTTNLPLPACPLLISPEDGAEDINQTSVDFEWGQVADATSYQLFIWPQSEAKPLAPAVTQAGTTYTAENLQSLTDYRWQVIAVNATGESFGCGFREFLTLPEFLLINEDDDAVLLTEGGDGTLLVEIE